MNEPLRHFLKGLDSMAFRMILWFYNHVLMYSFAEMMDFELSITEIDFHSRFLTAHDDYTEEDYRAIKRKLIAFKKKYIDT